MKTGSRRRPAPDCPDCGSQSGTVRAIVGVASYGKARISFLTCTRCGGYWHRKTGTEFEYDAKGNPDWARAADIAFAQRAAI